MPRGVAKASLPSKICLGCAKPMVWRKRWERCWDTVKFCSQRCRLTRRPTELASPTG